MSKEGNCLIRELALFAVVTLLLAMLPTCAVQKPEATPTPLKEKTQAGVETTITIIYDNNPYDSRLKPAWGFSCLVRLAAGTILFDTGGDSPTLLYNMNHLHIDPKEIDIVMLSHIHGDHVGGLAGFLKQNSEVTVYLPGSFPQKFKDEVRSYGAKVKEVHEAREILEGIYTTGELDGGIKEQSLIMKTKEGLVVVTGCAHPGVVNIVRKAKEIVEDRVYLVLGGFHFPPASVVQQFKELGVGNAAPCHCSGDEARRLFKEHFGNNYIECGAGARIVVPEVAACSR